MWKLATIVIDPSCLGMTITWILKSQWTTFSLSCRGTRHLAKNTRRSLVPRDDNDLETKILMNNL